MSEPIFRPEADGYRFIYEEGDIFVSSVPADKLGRLKTKILAPNGGILGDDFLDLRVDAARWKLANQAGRRDGVVPPEWADRLVAVKTKL